MALQLTVVTPHGFDAPNAYHRVEFLSLTTSSMSFKVRSYRLQGEDIPAFNDLPYACPYAIDGGNPFAQAYSYLKSLPEYSGASDV